ncbi:hypothetical protein BG262_02915 [Floricoccus penangensis]|uniref:Uncharacterized protein n=1 Tax=Floricoccus penangensis TaxID=1859475 RepID=A0A9Q5JG83_9LACT|nr:hypothetical protein [Floricoccus penangensis]OFI46766.1 hypothetical protein BG262_02915 [Floricoccus penangensis]
MHSLEIEFYLGKKKKELEKVNYVLDTFPTFRKYQTKILGEKNLNKMEQAYKDEKVKLESEIAQLEEDLAEARKREELEDAKESQIIKINESSLSDKDKEKYIKLVQESKDITLLQKIIDVLLKLIG